MQMAIDGSVNFEDKKNEAVRRMYALRYFKQSVQEFRRSGKIMINEPPFGAHYYVDEDEKLVEKISELEHEGKVCYAVIRSFIEDMQVDCILFVENEQEEWEYFDDDAGEGILFCYAFNRTYPEFSEYGSIGFKHTIAAGLLRTA